MSSNVATSPGISVPLPKSQVAEVAKWVDQYREYGYQPLPSRLDDKRPLICFGGHWETLIPGDPFLRFGYACNCQVMTGSRWGLMAIDLDGEAAPAAWAEMQRGRRRVPRTWQVSSGGRVKHLWFSLPSGCGPVPSGRLWSVWDETANEGRGDWAGHTAVERIGERKLIMAPPSLHPKTGEMYHWVKGSSPYDLARPALAPDWLVAMPVLERPRPAPLPPVAAATGRKATTRTHATSLEILDAIADKVGLAESWGLKLATTRENAAGWLSCHAAGRDDRNPSASFSPRSGRYWDPELGHATISLFRLGMLLGVYPDMNDARDHLAGLYLRRKAAAS